MFGEQLARARTPGWKSSEEQGHLLWNFPNMGYMVDISIVSIVNGIINQLILVGGDWNMASFFPVSWEGHHPN